MMDFFVCNFGTVQLISKLMYFVGMLMYFVLTGFPNILGN